LSKFTIRVYGLVLRNGFITYSMEDYMGLKIVKFPGGGMEFGEVPQEALIREFREELGVEINILELFYLTDFFQPSAFDPETQVISIYYLVELQKGYSISYHSVEPNLRFLQLPIRYVNPNIFTFPMDQHVVRLLQEAFD